MKRHIKKLALSRDTLRNLDGDRLQQAVGAITSRCGHCTEGSYCFQCITTDYTDCPNC